MAEFDLDQDKLTRPPLRLLKRDRQKFWKMSPGRTVVGVSHSWYLVYRVVRR